jgi:HD domain
MDAWRSLRGRTRLWAALAVLVLLAAAALLVHAEAGTPNPWMHFMYVGILLGAVVFKTAGGLIAGAVAGLLVGPWVTASPEPTADWLVRSAFFVLVGGFVGQAHELLDRRHRNEERLVKKIATIHARTLSTFASTVELRDKPTGGHSSRVAHNSRAVGLALDLHEEDVRAVYWAGLLHDLGKIGIPEKILQKPGKLTVEETSTMRVHSAIGADLLLSVSAELRPIADGIRTHHERWDGTGYPLGLAGEHIPLVGRIVSVVDVFEALTCKRPYREPRPVHEVLSFLRDRAGLWFDPSLVRILEDLYWQGEIYTAETVRTTLPPEEPAAVIPADPNEGSILRAAASADYHLGSSGRP